jgi:hypothetical protein
MTATGDRQRGVLLAATGENPMTIDTSSGGLWSGGSLWCLLGCLGQHG